MQEESFQIINVQKPGGHAHSLVIIKSKAITTNAANVGIFESNGQYTQREIDIIDRTAPPSSPESDVTRQYLSPISPKLCINYGNNKHNPGYCGIFGMICIIAFRHYNPHATAATHHAATTAAASPHHATATPLTRLRSDPVVGGRNPHQSDPVVGGRNPQRNPQWLQKWKQLLDYMRQDIPDESALHGCLGVALAAKVQEIIASATPASPAAFKQAEKEIVKEIKKCVKSIANYRQEQ
jgi:hypothetical protein